ncbi:hypothetical protein GCM10022386_19170 [Flavobacterium cheonhonense]|uniref:Protein BatD n=1 Tax=Flavobacterium cheonhonense TaxID=706185 RepID=A0ABP7U1Q1_9FLAO|nr:hypothetical protein [Flavobacterium cheonhonense]
MKTKLVLILSLLSIAVWSQPKVTTAVDSVKNKIGAEFKLSLKTNVDTLSKVKFPESKFFGALEVLESYKVDTVKKGDRYELIKKYGLTQFDSGKYTIPRIPIIINGKTVYSDSLAIEISDVKVDTLKQKMFDIKDIATVKSPMGNWWIYVLVVIGLIGLGFLIFYLLKNRKPKAKAEVIVYKTPIEKATTLLQQLESKELWQKGAVKDYYSELTDIVRNYIEEEIKIPAMESTTSELIEGLRKAAKQKKLKLSNDTVENLEKVLQQADLVKFAKVTPMDYEIEEDKKRISNTIVTIHKSIPEVVETEDELALWNEQQKEKARLEKLKREKRKKMAIIVGSAAFLILGTLGFFVATKGFDYVKDNLIGHPTKELLEGEWVYSQYGNPGVKIETPKVLMRQDASKILPKNAMALIKEMQIFTYGSMIDDFYIGVSTSTFKEETKIDLEQAAEGSIKIFETQGASNILVKTEEFDTQKGITGRKAYGTLSMVDKVSGKSTKMYYEILIFAQSNGIQQITVLQREDDQYAKKIGERMLNSVELKIAQ